MTARRPSRIPSLRIAAIQRLIVMRHGGPCQAPDAEAYMRAAAPHLAALRRDPLRFAEEVLPCLAPRQVREIVAGAADRRITNDAFARLLALREFEVAALAKTGIPGLVSIDRPAAVRRQDRQERDRLAKACRRRAEGRPTAADRAEARRLREAVLARAGMSRATFFRLPKAVQATMIEHERDVEDVRLSRRRLEIVETGASAPNPLNIGEGAIRARGAADIRVGIHPGFVQRSGRQGTAPRPTPASSHHGVAS